MQRLEVESITNSGQRSGARFGKYRLIRELATGGMAKLYVALIDGPGGFAKQCVVKKILPEHSGSQEFSRMFVTEARVAALLKHAGIVQVFDFGEINGEYYIAMEYVDGGSLEELLRRSFENSLVPGARIATNVGIEVADALSYVHNAVGPDGRPLKLVHRDLTPGNVMITREGVAKITDFGVVKASINHAHTQAGVVKGKFSYMAPEQIRDDAVDHRVDLFALGILLHEMATGRFLFRRTQLAETINAVARCTVPLPSTIVKGFPEELERVIMRCLTADREQRYQHASEIRVDLEAIRAKQQWTTGPNEVADILQRLVLPNRAAETLIFTPPPAPPPEIAEEEVIAADADVVSEVTAAPSLPAAGAPAKGEARWQQWAIIALALVASAALWAVIL